MKKLTFKKGLLLLGIVYAVIIVIGLAIFWNYLSRYEAQHPVGAMNTYFDALQRGDTEKIFADSEFTFDAYNTQSIYIEYLSKKYMNGNGDWQYAAMETDEKTGALTYDVYESDKKYGTLYLTRGEEGGWRVRSDWAYQAETVLCSPTVPYINGAAAKPEGEQEAVPLFEGAAGEVPTVARYRIKTLLPPAITLQDGAVVFTQTEDGATRVTQAPSAADAQTLTMLAEQAARTYACFISGDAELAALNALLESGTPFAKGLRAYDAKWYNQHETVEFQNMQVRAPVMWSAAAFSVQVSFDFVVNRKYDTHTYPTAYDIALRRAGDGFKVVNIAPM